jgi:hypothetical protein
VNEMVSVEELELLAFFEVEPHRLDPGVEWPYNDFAYEVTRGDTQLSFALAPAYRDVRIILKRGGTTVYELNAMSVRDVRYLNDSGRENLEVTLGAREKLWIRLKPEIGISHEITGET